MSLSQLSLEQQSVVESWGQGLAVLAGAGSGKTTTLVAKCAELLRRNPEARIAAVSFTERSASDLREKMSSSLPPKEGGALHGHWVMTIHGLCAAVIRENPAEAGIEGDEGMLSESQSRALWEEAVQGLFVDDIPEAVNQSLDALLDRESRDGVYDLLSRVKSLEALGVGDFLSESPDPDSRNLYILSRWVLDRYFRLKRRRGALDFNDLEWGADRALQYESVRRAYHSRFDLVLVDEFQDTNPIQARILSQLVKPDFSNLCVVGDPKQSIYRFRDADVSVFEEFCARMPVKITLSRNFRSRPGILDFTNSLCSKVFEQSSMVYQALAPHKPAQDPEAHGSAVIRLDLQDPKDLANWILSEVKKGVRLDQMALLLRKIRGGNEKWLKALSSAGIPIAVGSGGLFWEDPRVREMVALLKWWDNPANALSGGIFFRAPWMGVPDRTLDQWLSEDRTWVKPFFSEESQARFPIARALAALRDRNARPGEILMALLTDEATEHELGAALLGLWHRVEDFSSAGMDFHSVVAELTRALEESRREREVPPPRNDGQLPILTLHSSKGLEFDHVILVDLAKKGRAGNAPLLFWDRIEGAYLGGRDDEGERDSKDPMELHWREIEKRKNLEESKRLFYVALTRAKERLILGCLDLSEDEIFGKKRKSAPEDYYGEENWRAWLEVSRIPVERVLPGESPSGKRVRGQTYSTRPVLAAIASQWLRPRHSVTEWNLFMRCPRAYEWKYIRPRAVIAEVQSSAVLSPSGIAQAELGTKVHGFLETKDFEGLRKLETELGAERFQAEPLIRWAESSPWMRKTPGSGDVWSELAFEVPAGAHGTETVVGSIDRLVKHPEGYALIDFKVTRKLKGRDELLEMYQGQIDLYAWAISRLDPEAQRRIQAWIVQITGDAVQEVPVPIREIAWDGFLGRITAIVDGKEGPPTPGEVCRFCDFRSVCDVAAKF